MLRCSGLGGGRLRCFKRRAYRCADLPSWSHLLRSRSVRSVVGRSAWHGSFLPSVCEHRYARHRWSCLMELVECRVGRRREQRSVSRCWSCGGGGMVVIDRVHIEPIGLQAPTKVGFPVSASTSSRSSFSTLQPPHHLAAIRCDPTSSVPSGTATSTERSSANLIRTLANNRPTDGHGLIRLSLESRRAGLSICGSCILSDLRKRRSCAVSNSLKNLRRHHGCISASPSVMGRDRRGYAQW